MRMAHLLAADSTVGCYLHSIIQWLSRKEHKNVRTSGDHKLMLEANTHTEWTTNFIPKLIWVKEWLMKYYVYESKFSWKYFRMKLTRMLWHTQYTHSFYAIKSERIVRKFLCALYVYTFDTCNLLDLILHHSRGDWKEVEQKGSERKERWMEYMKRNCFINFHSRE